MQEQSKKLPKGIIFKKVVATICLVGIIVLTILHSQYMDNRFFDMTKKYFFELSKQTVANFERSIENDFFQLDMLSMKLGNLDELNEEEVLNFLSKEFATLNYKTLGVVYSSGDISYVAETNVEGDKLYRKIDLSDRDYVTQVFKGEKVVSKKLFSRIDEEIVNVYAVPIYRDERVIGALIAYRDEEYHTKLMNEYTLEGNGVSFIINDGGNILFQSGEDALLTDKYTEIKREVKAWWTKYKPEIHDMPGTFLSEDACSRELSKGHGYYIAHTKLSINDWHFVTYMSRCEGGINEPGYSYVTLHSLFYVMVMLLAVLAFMVFQRSQYVEKLESVIKEQSIHDTSYRIIMEQTKEIIFEYNPLEKTYYYTSNFKHTFGYEPTKRGILEGLQNDYIHPEDVVSYIEMYNRMKENRHLAQTEVRVVTYDGDYIWTRIQMTGIFDSEGQMVRVIGKILDINETKEKMDHLAKQAVLDSATGLYNKQTTENMIKLFLETEGQSGKHALLIVDIDDFKGINDEYGHRQGDLILLDLAKSISHLFRSTDIIGRIGGDEFMVLIKDVDDMESIKKKAHSICNVFALQEEDAVGVSTCIGIALYDKDGSTYHELYEAADKALYHCKKNGKASYTFYDNEINAYK